MPQTMRFKIGAYASCTDGACGQVSRIIVNPVTREVTHLAVDPKHRHGPGRLVPVDLVDATTGQIRLRCTLAEFQTLRPAQEAVNSPRPWRTGNPAAGHRRLRPIRRGRHTPRPDRLCDRRRDRAGPRAGRGTWRPPCNPCAPPGGAHAGPQGSGYPDQRRDEDRDSAYPSQPHQTPGERPAARGTLITQRGRPARGHPVPPSNSDRVVRDDTLSVTH
jgi:hypothetical protein